VTQFFIEALRWFFGLTYWPHARCSGAILIIGGAPWSSAQRGVELAETTLNINVRRFEARYYPEINEKLPDNAGETIARGISSKYSRDVTCEGETIGSQAHTINSAYTFANDVNDFGDGTGGLYIEDATVTQGRAEWRAVTIRASSNPNLA